MDDRLMMLAVLVAGVLLGGGMLWAGVWVGWRVGTRQSPLPNVPRGTAEEKKPEGDEKPQAFPFLGKAR